MNFYTQTLLELVLALGVAMVFGNAMAIARRNKDLKIARESLKTSPRTSKHQNQIMVKEQLERGKATLAVAPLGRSLIFITIGAFVAFCAGVTLLIR